MTGTFGNNKPETQKKKKTTPSPYEITTISISQMKDICNIPQKFLILRSKGPLLQPALSV